MILGNLVDLLHRLQTRGRGRVVPGPIDVRLDADTILVPDLIFVRTGRLGILKETGVDGAPDLVAEVKSGEGPPHELEAKIRAFLQYGVGECWVVDPDERAVRVHLGNGTGSRPRVLREDEWIVFLGHGFPVGAVFTDLF